MRIIRFSDLETIPWKNGGGVTREIAALRENANIIWRLSMADVERDGPFSNFAGLTRILTVIEGKGIALTSAQHDVEVRWGVPVTFDGGQAREAKLIDGPIRDLNVMFDPKCCSAEVTLVKAPAHAVLSARANQTIAVMVLAGETIVERKYPIRFGDTVICHAGSIVVDLAGTASAVLVRINHLD